MHSQVEPAGTSAAVPARAGRLVVGRSVVFSVLMTLHVCATALVTGAAVPLLPRASVLGIARWWARTNLVLLKAVVGLDVEIRGVENIPKGASLIAAKHQSALETFAIVPYVPDPVFVLKRELTWLPFFGWFLLRLKMIAINRRAGGEALIQMLEQADRAARAGRQIVIYPEGTRRPVGAPPQYKMGVVHLYDRLKLPCVPVAIDTGVFWRRRAVGRRQGRAVIQFLEVIEPGLSRDVFMATLRDRVETATRKLVAEALGEPPADDPPRK